MHVLENLALVFMKNSNFTQNQVDSINRWHSANMVFCRHLRLKNTTDFDIKGNNSFLNVI